MDEFENKRGLLKHFIYEVKMMRADFFLLNDIRYQNINGVIFESFLVHIRNLYEFFYKNVKFSLRGQAYVGHFVSTKFVTEKEDNNIIKICREKINNNLSHLTYYRNNSEINWRYFHLIYNHFKKLIIQFLEKISEGKYANSELANLLKELKEEKII